MKTRIGKIARLPRAIRNQLNQRLHDGERGQRLLEWLNALPEVQTVLAAEFEGRPVNAQNLSDWKKGGYREWVLLQEALELAERLGEDAAELQAEGRPPLTDTLALWVVSRYAVATRTVSAQDGPEQWRLLRELCADVVELRRGDHSAERLRLEREQFELARAKEHERTEAGHQEWAEEHREEICKGFVSNAEKIAAMRKAMFADVEEYEKSGKLKLPLDPFERDRKSADENPPTENSASIQGESRLIKPDEKPCDCATK